MELSPEKINKVDFHKKDFEYLNDTFYHLEVNREGKEHYYFGPSKIAIKEFKQDLKLKTRKTYTKSFEQWEEELNPILRGKYKYMLGTVKAWQAVKEILSERKKERKGKPEKNMYQNLDAYTRQRLRDNFANRGRRHSNVRLGKMYTVKYGNWFFHCVLKLVSGDYLLRKLFYTTLTYEEYARNRELEKKKKKKKYSDEKANFFKYAYAK